MDPLYVKNNKLFTQIGSLPFDDISEAVSYSLQHDIPFLPELTQLGDGMGEYIKHPGKMSCLDDFCNESFETVKIQCVGPKSLMNYKKDDGTPYDENASIQIIHDHLSGIIPRLDCKELIIFLDEPSLGGTGQDYETPWDTLMSTFTDDTCGVPVIWGVHTCGIMQFDLLLKSKMDIISFDASKFDITLYYPRRGKKVAWGIKDISDVKDWQKGDLLTLPCGIGLKDEKHAYEKFDMLKNARP